jgi:hypothetical protein
MAKSKKGLGRGHADGSIPSRSANPAAGKVPRILDPPSSIPYKLFKTQNFLYLTNTNRSDSGISHP